MKVDAAQVVQAGVYKPHTSKYIFHVLQLAFNSAFVDERATIYHDAFVDPLNKDL